MALTPHSHLLSADEVEVLTRLFCSQGVDKVRLTGGEPLVRKDLVDIVSKSFDLSTCTTLICDHIYDIPTAGSLVAIPGMKSVSMTTNGVTLSHKLRALQEAGIGGINISLDTLQAKKFEFITRRRGFEKVLRGINQALDAGITPLKVTL